MGSIGNDISGIGSIVGGIGSFIAGQDAAQADQAEAQGFGVAAQYAQENAFFAGEAGGLQELAAARRIQQTQGAQAATAATNGLSDSGSALALMRDTVSQGSLAESQIGLNTSIQEQNFYGQAASDLAMQQAAQAQASAASTGGTFGLFGGLLGGAAKIFSAGLF